MPEQNYAVATVPLTCGYPWGPLGRWQTSRECHRFLHWGYAEALSESSLAFCALRLEPSLQWLLRSIIRLLAGWSFVRNGSQN